MSLKGYINYFFLNQNQKFFIKHNYDVFESFKNDNSKQKIILLEINRTASNIIAYSYLANQLSKKSKAKLVGYSHLIPRNSLKKKISKASNFFGNPIHSIYKSFGVDSFITPSFNNSLSHESDLIYKEHLNLINNKKDIEDITVYGLVFGDLIYDFFLTTYKEPTIDIESEKFRLHLKYCVDLIVYWNKFFIDNDVEAINVSHTCYANAFPLRIAIKLGINCFQATDSHIYRLSKDKIYAYKDFVDFKTNFAKLEDKEKITGIKKAKQRIAKRFSGEVGVDMSYSTKSAFNAPSQDRLLSKSSKTKILLAPHCFFDSPHPWGVNLFPDIFEWLTELVRISNLTDYEWYVKTHPDFMIETKSLVDEFFKPHLKFKMLPADASHLQLVEEGIDYALTMYGTVGFEYAAMNKPVINASLNNPHIAYDFNINPKSKEEYTKILMSLGDVKHKINLKDVYEYYYMQHLHYSKNWLFNNHAKFQDEFVLNKNKNSWNVYSYWIDNWSQKRHEEILDSVEKFITSNDYRIISIN